METFSVSKPQPERVSMNVKRGRPRLTCHVRQIRFTLSLREGEDDDLLLFFADIPERRRAAALKAALRAGGISLKAGSVPITDDLDLTIQGLVFG
jgi:hypothetical protein